MQARPKALSVVGVVSARGNTVVVLKGVSQHDRFYTVVRSQLGAGGVCVQGKRGTSRFPASWTVDSGQWPVDGPNQMVLKIRNPCGHVPACFGITPFGDTSTMRLGGKGTYLPPIHP